MQEPPSWTSTLSNNRNYLFFTQWHETTIFQEWKAKKELSNSPFPPATIFQFFCILSRKTPYYHGNSKPFPCLYHIPRFPTAFSVTLIPFSAKINIILLLFTFPHYIITETPDFCVKVYFCLIVRFFPLSPSYQRHPKTKKLGPTIHRDEPHQA